MQKRTVVKKIGLLGGTFDPVHNGHLAVAHHVQNVLGLDAVWFIPAAKPPHKAGHVDNLQISDFAHRFAMLERAVGLDSSLIVSDIESKRSAPSYSIDTITILRQLTGGKTDFSFIIGTDAFLEIDTWKCFKDLPTLVDFIIISRPGYLPDKVKQVIRRNYPYYRYDQSFETWSSPTSQGKFVLLHMTPVPISSTEIRGKVRKREDISGMVPTAVESYIKEHKLYTSCR